MRNKFVLTENVKSFSAGVDRVELRGAVEAGFLVVSGDAGFGKSRTGLWYAVQTRAARVRLKAAATPHWFLTDLVRELGEQSPAHTSERLFGQAIEALLKEPRPVVVDEAENGLARDMAVIETVRDVADLAEVPVVLIGRENVPKALRRERQIWTRVSALVEFGPASLADVELLCTELCEVEVGDDLVAAIHEGCEGYVREAVKAIKNVERVGLKLGGKIVELDDMAGASLTQDFQRRRPAKKTGLRIAG